MFPRNEGDRYNNGSGWILKNKRQHTLFELEEARQIVEEQNMKKLKQGQETNGKLLKERSCV